MFPVAVMVIPFLMGALWTGQALAIDNDVDDEVITVPYDPRPVPSAKQAHHSLRWRHVPAHSILLKELKTGTTPRRDSRLSRLLVART